MLFVVHIKRLSNVKITSVVISVSNRLLASYVSIDKH